LYHARPSKSNKVEATTKLALSAFLISYLSLVEEITASPGDISNLSFFFCDITGLDPTLAIKM
jgi:hypothetical protein